MSQYIVSDIRGATSYKYMENGRPILGERNGTKFDEATAETVARQLATFRGDGDWRALPIIGPAPLVERYKTFKELAEALHVSTATLRDWRNREVIADYALPAAHRLLGNI